MKMPPRERTEEIVDPLSDLEELESVVLSNIGTGMDAHMHRILIDAVRRVLVVKEQERL